MHAKLALSTTGNLKKAQSGQRKFLKQWAGGNTLQKQQWNHTAKYWGEGRKEKT